jgi:putative acetyltransferase
MTIRRINGSDKDFAKLVALSDAFYRQTFGAAMDYYDQFNTIDTIEQAVVVYDDHVPVACGCFRSHDEYSAEIKRMYVLPTARNKGIATIVLKELESWAKELGFESTVLETSKSLTEAVALYQKHGYQPTENWGPYAGIETSICMKKGLSAL